MQLFINYIQILQEPGMNSAPKSPRAKKRAAKWRLSGMIKTASGCKDCGYAKHAQALQFDHVSDNKKASVSNLIRSDYAWSTILEEINKCEIRCANCHAVMTAYRKTQNENYSSVSQSDQS
jgi:hypothetical protein